VHVWVDETRPLLQGARLTAWELKQAGVEVTVLVDGAAAALLFGAANALQINAQQFGVPISSQFIGMFPYLLTIIVLAGVVGRSVPPAADGRPYERESQAA